MKRNIISSIVTVVLGAAAYYIFLPALNIKSEGLWFFVILLCLIYGFVSGIIKYHEDVTLDREGNWVPLNQKKRFKISKGNWGFRIALIIFALYWVVYGIGSSKFFHAKAYSEIITVKDTDASVIPSSENTDTIALMDTKSAEKLGDREIGALSQVVSQYEVGSYTQIDYQGKPMKIAPLRHADFFKWLKNKDLGTPGYVMVNPVEMKAEYKALEHGMKYVPSSYLGQDLTRYLRFHYPTVMFEGAHLEIDEEGKPMYVIPTFDFTIGLFGGWQVNGCILLDPSTGALQKVAVKDIPTWADVIYNGNLICEQYNNHAILNNGFWNSIFGQVGCHRVTESSEDDVTSDYGYVAKDGDIWIYTGVTSVNGDSSNIGFILSNERTEETFFVPCAGADEFSAMAAAEGEVQEKRYSASFPSLILVDENPTYIMVLKDKSGLVKMYAAVNVEQYNIVSTATNQDECIRKYKALLSGEITAVEANSTTTEAAPTSQQPVEPVEVKVDLSTAPEKTITVVKRVEVVENGNTYLYIVDQDQTIYKAKYTDVMNMLLVNDGDEITIRTDGTWYELK